ncbi:MAG TPA: ABC transporter substrate-binding protein [Longimicrobium sp.]|nr:ABC transporter substrate-binding protein [Longimicrobium sp.]
MTSLARVRAAARGALGLAALALAACGGGDDGREQGKAPRDGQPQRGGTAVIAEVTDIANPMPVTWHGGLDADMMDVMYMGLTAQRWGDGRLVFLHSDRNPYALSWHHEFVGPDSTAIRYRMRSALKWSDGHPITAHDVVWTYAMYADTATASPRLENVALIDSVKAENDSTVVFHFKRRYPGMMFDSGLNIAPRHVYQGTPPAQLMQHPVFSRMQDLVVSGPFKVGAYQSGTQLTLVPNPYFPVRPRLDRIVIRRIPETTTRFVELQNGTVDLARGAPFDVVAQLRRTRPDLGWERERLRYWEFVAFNRRTFPPFADREVRRALTLAVNIPEIRRSLRMEEFTTHAVGPYAPIFKDLYDPRALPPPPFDAQEAARILESRGWRDTDGDGIREKDGRPLRFTMITNQGNQRRADVATMLQRYWRAVGVDMRPRILEFGTFQELMIGKKEYEAALGSWGVQLTPDITPLWRPDSPFNIVGFDDAQAQALMDQALAAPTEQEANPRWRAAAERIVQDHPYLWLYFYDNVTGRSARLRGVKVDSYGAYQNTWEWWVSGEARRAPGAAADTGAPKDTAK